MPRVEWSNSEALLWLAELTSKSLTSSAPAPQVRRSNEAKRYGLAIFWDLPGTYTRAKDLKHATLLLYIAYSARINKKAHTLSQHTVPPRRTDWQKKQNKNIFLQQIQFFTIRIHKQTMDHCLNSNYAFRACVRTLLPKTNLITCRAEWNNFLFEVIN